MTSTDCLFCKIVKGGVPSEKIYGDDFAYAFLDIHPINRGHVLVVPKKHAESIYDISEHDFAELMKLVHKLAPKIKRAVGADGINIGMNNGHAAGQLVFHAHVHIIPRFEDDGFSHWHGNPYQEGELTPIAGQIRAELGS